MYRIQWQGAKYIVRDQHSVLKQTNVIRQIFDHLTNHGTEPLEKGMSLSNRKVFLPNIKLSQNIRKAVQKNVACEEELIKRLFDVDLKKRDALNEITLKKDAFLKEQWRLRRESMPDVYSRHILN